MEAPVDDTEPKGVLEPLPLGDDDVFLLLTASRSKSDDAIDSDKVTLILVGNETR